MNKLKQLLENVIIVTKMLFGGYTVEGRKYVYKIYYNVFENIYDIYILGNYIESETYVTSRSTLDISIKFIQSRN